MLVSLLGWMLCGLVAYVAASKSVRKWQGADGEVTETDESWLPEIREAGKWMIAAAGIFGGAWGAVVIGTSASRPGAGTAGSFQYGAPNTPTLDIIVTDTSTWAWTGSVFVGSGDATHDSTQIQVLRVAGDTLIDSIWGPTTDSVVASNANLKADTTYVVRMRYKANPNKGGWSAYDSLSVWNWAPLIMFDPDNYTNATTFLRDSDTNGTRTNAEPFIQVEGANDTLVTLEIGNVGDGYINRRNVMRYNFPDTSVNNGDTNIDYTVRRILAVGNSLDPSTQIWWEVQMRYASNFLNSLGFDGDGSKRHKHLNTGCSSTGRFDYQLHGNGNGLEVGVPGGAYQTNETVPDSSVFNDTQWHRMRATMKVDASTGVYKVWIDDDVIVNFSGDTDNGLCGSWYGLGPANSNRGWKYDTWMDVGLMRIWTRNPGW